MSYPVARLRAWAAHHRMAWWSAAALFALLTGLTVQAATAVPTCVDPVAVAASSAPSGAPGPNERGVALARGPDPLALQPDDRVDLWAMDPTASSGTSPGVPTARRVVESARVLMLDERTLTVAVPADRMAQVAGALQWGDLIPALVPALAPVLVPALVSAD